MDENEAFEGFASQERIRAWLGADPSRRERLRREFARVWTQMESKSQAGSTALVQPRPVTIRATAPAPPVAPAPAPVPAPQPKPQPAPKPQPQPDAQPKPIHEATARQLKVLCTSCEAMDVWAEGGHVRCRHCGHEYRDMLELVPVKPVGVFHFVFGEGSAGLIAAGGVVLLLLLLYLAATRL